MADSEDHREKNILLAKNLNEVKIDLRKRKKDLASLQTKLRFEQQRNSKLELEQVTILNRIDFLKKQLDETFIKNTFGYIDLSRQLDEMHQNSIQSIGDTSIFSVSTSSAVNSTHSSFLAKIKAFSATLTTDDSIAEHEPSNNPMNVSKSSENRHSLSFNSFRIGLNSTFVKDADPDSEFNLSFVSEQTEAESRLDISSLQQSQIHSNVTVRRGKNNKNIDTPKVKKRIAKNHSRGQKENHLAAIGPGGSPSLNHMVLRRTLKKIDYKESSFRYK